MVENDFHPQAAGGRAFVIAPAAFLTVPAVEVAFKVEIYPSRSSEVACFHDVGSALKFAIIPSVVRHPHACLALGVYDGTPWLQGFWQLVAVFGVCSGQMFANARRMLVVTVIAAFEPVLARAAHPTQIAGVDRSSFAIRRHLEDHPVRFICGILLCPESGFHQ